MDFSHAKALSFNKEVCEQIHWVDTPAFQFTRNEKNLICGHSESPVWHSVPLPQARFHIRAFFEARGYFSPKLYIENNILYLEAGPQSHIQQIHFIDAPENFFQIMRPRKWANKALTPQTLDELIEWTHFNLKFLGYPCSEIEAQASPESGHIFLTIRSGPRGFIQNIERDRIGGLNEGLWTRFEAIRVGDPYDLRKLSISSQRIIQDGIAQSSFFRASCKDTDTDTGIDLHHRLIAGRSRLIALGIGATTEEYPILRARWRSSRIGELGSSIEALSTLSLPIQQAKIQGELYALPKIPFLYWAPGFSIKREKERSYEFVSSQVESLFGFNTDFWNGRWSFSSGPSLNYIMTAIGYGPESDWFLTIDNYIQYMSHDFEYYLFSPRQGLQWQLQTKSQRKGFLAQASADRFEFNSTWLWNYNKFDPPLLVLGIRTQLATTRVAESSQDTSKVGLDFRHFLGGDANIRGFSRREIDAGGEGYFSTWYSGLELRLVRKLPANLEPFILADIAAKSRRSFSIDPGYFWSPGLGLRWSGLIGTFRGTYAYGVVKDAEAYDSGLRSHGQWFLSYGSEF